MSKTIAFKPPPKPPVAADDWVRSRGGPLERETPSAPAPAQEAPAEPMKRFTIDVSVSLHARIKMACAAKGAELGKTVTMADVLRDLLEREFPAP